MPNVVRQRGGFAKLNISPDAEGDALRDLRNLQGVRQSGAKEGVLTKTKDLRLASEAPKRRAVKDARTVHLSRTSLVA